MLRELDLKLIEKEKERLYIKELFPLYNHSLETLLKEYSPIKYTVHFYDSEPQECNNCDLPFSCKDCDVMKMWDGSKEQLSFNNWIDYYAPGQWGMTQKSMECEIDKIFKKEILHNKESIGRLFFYKSNKEDKELINIFYYNRDKERSDYWFVFEKIREV